MVLSPSQIRFTSYGGSKSNLENFAYLPTMMYNITDGIPQFAQWNYRILCHPVKQHVPTHYMEVNFFVNRACDFFLFNLCESTLNTSSWIEKGIKFEKYTHMAVSYPG